MNQENIPNNIQKTIEKKSKRVSIIMAIIMSSVMGLLFPFLVRMKASPEALKSMGPAPVMYISSLVESIIVGVIVVLIIPLGKCGILLARKLNAQPPTLKFNFLNGLPISVVSALIVSGICSFTSMAISHSHMPKDIAPPLLQMWFGTWFKSLPLLLVVSILLSTLISPLVVNAVGLNKKPE